MLRWTESDNINKKGPRLSKLRKVFAPAPPSLQAPLDIETITAWQEPYTILKKQYVEHTTFRREINWTYCENSFKAS